MNNSSSWFANNKSRPSNRLANIGWHPYNVDLFKSSVHSDALLRVSATPESPPISIPVHRRVLRRSAKFFELLFFGPSAEPGRRDYAIVESDPAAFLVFLEHLYGGYADIANVEDALKLYAFGDKYMSPVTMTYCRLYILPRVDSVNAAELFAWARQHDEHDIKSACREVWCASNKEMIDNGSLDAVDLDAFKDLVLDSK